MNEKCRFFFVEYQFFFDSNCCTRTKQLRKGNSFDRVEEVSGFVTGFLFLFVFILFYFIFFYKTAVQRRWARRVLTTAPDSNLWRMEKETRKKKKKKKKKKRADRIFLIYLPILIDWCRAASVARFVFCATNGSSQPSNYLSGELIVVDVFSFLFFSLSLSLSLVCVCVCVFLNHRSRSPPTPLQRPFSPLPGPVAFLLTT